jgi:hypothetical protein
MRHACVVVMHAQWLLPPPDLVSSEEAPFSHKYKACVNKRKMDVMDES